MVEQFANKADSTLNGAIDNVTTSIVVNDGSRFPSTGNFRVLLGSDTLTGELVIATARSGNTLTVIRGQEGTTAQSWPDGMTVTHILTAGAVIVLRDTLKGKTLDTSLETISSTQDGYTLTWLNTDGYWAARPGSPFTTYGNELNTTRTLSIDGYGTYASAHYNPQLYVNGTVLSSSSFSVGEIPLNTIVFDYVSDGYQSFVVPAGVTQLQVKMWGPGGGTGNYSSGSGYGGGSGGYSTGFLTVTPGETLVLAVGSGGKKSVTSTGNGGLGGWPGGGNGARGDASAGGGGGLTGVFSTSYAQTNALMVAGGGGGSSGWTGGGQPGAGGGSSGNDASTATGGKGGTQIFGGFGGGPAVYTVTQTTGGTYETGVTDTGNHTDDSPLTTVSLPFPFVFYGTSYSSANVSSNGFINFGTNLDTAYAWDIPAAHPPTINLWQRDNDTRNAGFGWYTTTVGSAPNRIFVLEYRGYQLSNPALTINAEVKLYEGSNTFEVLYGTSTATDTSGTIGIQDNNGAHYTIYNNNTAPPAAGTRLIYAADANITGKPLAGGNAYTDVTTSQVNDSGGGGSGYFGGGAGQGDGQAGGGGSGYLHPTRVTNGTTTAGTNGAIGVIGAAPPNATDTNYVSGIGIGGATTGTGSDGGNGRVVISYGNSSSFGTNSVVFGNNASITAPVGYADMFLNTVNGGNITLNPSSGLVTLQGTAALSSTTDLSLSFTNSLKVSSSAVNKFRVFSTGAVNIGEAVNNDTSTEAQAGLTGPLINIASSTGTLGTVANQATIFNQSGSLYLQGNTDVRFMTGSTTRGYWDVNGILRGGPSAATTATMQGASWPQSSVDYLYLYNSTGSCWSEVISGNSGARAALQVMNNAVSNTVGVSLFGPGTAHAIVEYAGNGVIEQSGASTSALVFTKRDGTAGASFASTGAIWQSGAWTIGRTTNNDTSAEAQAGLTGPLLNITQTTGGTLTTVANQALLYNVAGVATLQGNAGHNFVTGTTSVASTSSTKFITSLGRRQATTLIGTNVTVQDGYDIMFVPTLTGSITITMPATPTTGDTYLVKDKDGSASTFNIVISGNGKNIEQFTGAPAASLTLNQNYDSVTLIYNGTTWSII